MSKWFLALIAMCVVCTGCNYSVIMNATHGQASDLVDETDTASPDIKPNIEIPLPAIP